MGKVCLYCGNYFYPNRAGRPKLFCRPACRNLFWKKENRNKANAHNAIYRARKKGKIIDKLFCEICGNTNPKDRHHLDYNKPLKVIWVCKKCHDSLKRK